MEHIFEREHKINLRSNSYVIRELSNVSLISTNTPIIISNSTGGGPNSNGHSNQTSTSGSEIGDPVRLAAPLSPATSEGGLRSILKKSTSPTPMSMANTNGSARGHPDYAEYMYSSHSRGDHTDHNGHAMSNQNVASQYQKFHNDLNKSLEEKLHSLKNDAGKHHE